MGFVAKPVALDLFAGCGGLTLGLKNAGFAVRGAFEVDSLAADTYRMNHPEVELWEMDIRDVSIDEVKQRLGLGTGDLDLLAGCPPCQGFSSMRTLNGAIAVADERNDLVYEILRFAKDLRPRAIMVENVPALANDVRMKRIVNQLEEWDYVCRVAILDASRYGVPQRRRRMVLLAGRGTPIDFAEETNTVKTVRQTIGDLHIPGTGSDPLHDIQPRRSARVMERIRAIPHDGGSRTSLGPELQLACHTRSSGFKDVYGRMAWDEVAPTITGGCINPSKGRFLHPDQDRAITLREAALLQSFPSDYRFSLARGRYPTALLIGNALPPEFARRQAQAILQALPSISSDS